MVINFSCCTVLVNYEFVPGTSIKNQEDKMYIISQRTRAGSLPKNLDEISLLFTRFGCYMPSQLVLSLHNNNLSLPMVVRSRQSS